MPKSELGDDRGEGRIFGPRGAEGRGVTRQDWLAVLALAALFVVMLAATWQRWTHPIIDHGRELNLPARILAGERLYVDILYYYGPFAPYFNALLYRLGGVRVATLHASGGGCAVLILLLLYWLARQLMSPSEAALAAALVMLTCAFNVYLDNYIQPYAYAALYGLVFALGALVGAVRYLQSPAPSQLCAAGICAGLVLICKPELGASAVAPSGIAWALASFSARRWLWRDAALFALPLIAISGATYGLLLRHVGWQTMVADNYAILSAPQLAYFSRHLNGMLDWPKTGWAMAAGAGVGLLIAGLSALLGIALSGHWRSLWRGDARRAAAVVIIGLSLWSLEVKARDVLIDIQPLRAAPLVLSAVIVAAGWRWWRARARGACLSRSSQVLLVVAAFGLISLTRVWLNVSLKNSYPAFTVPASIVIFLYLLFRTSPALLLPAGRPRECARRCAAALVTVTVILLAVSYARLARTRRDFAISAPRGRLLTNPAFGRPVAEAIAFVRERTSPDDYLVALPQGTLINFLAERPSPLREEIIVPGFVTGATEADVIHRLGARRVPLILLANFPTPEYRDRAFGTDYNQGLMRWIQTHYHRVAVFGHGRGRAPEFGDPEFFILAYERDP